MNKRAEEHYDHNGKELEVLLKTDPYFIIQYLQDSSNEKGFHYRKNNIDASSVWSVPDIKNFRQNC